MTADEVLNYFVNHPPIEVTDMAAYQEILQITVGITVQELSENDPILEVKEITTPSPVSPVTDFVFIDLYTDIDSNFMEFVVLYEGDTVPSEYSSVLDDYLYFPSDVNGLIDYIADRDSLYTIREWTNRKIKHLLFSGTKIKLKPQTTYTCLYHRYRDVTEVPLEMVPSFKKLLEINLFLQFYKSDVLSSEAQIRSVSISGLSVSFNVPSAETRIQTIQRLENEKNNVLSSLALNYDDGEVGLIF